MCAARGQTLWPRRQPLLGGGAQQQQLALLAPQESYQSSRAVALQNVERTIHELGAIFQDLALMVRLFRVNIQLRVGRAVALQNVERTIHELGAIFQDLALMVRPAARVRVLSPAAPSTSWAPSSRTWRSWCALPPGLGFAAQPHHPRAGRHLPGPGAHGAPCRQG